MGKHGLQGGSYYTPGDGASVHLQTPELTKGGGAARRSLPWAALTGGRQNRRPRTKVGTIYKIALSERHSPKNLYPSNGTLG